MTLEQAIQQVSLPDSHASSQAARRWDRIAKPLHGLGLLEDAVCRIAGVQGTTRVRIQKRALAVFCADNGVVREGVTQTGSEVTALVAANLCHGKTSVSKMAQVADVDVYPVDMGMNTPVREPGMVDCAVARGTQDLACGPAMSRAQAVQALEYGISLACRLAKEGYQVFAAGEMGIGNTTTSSAVASVLLGRPAEEMTGRGAGLSSEGLCRKVSVIEQAIRLNRPDRKDPLDVLAKLGGFDIAGMAGFSLGAAACKVPVVVDGFISSVAALSAVRLCPAAQGYLLASHVSGEPAGKLVLDALGLSPVITAGMHLGEGTGAVALFPLLDMALAVYEGMSTFEEIELEEYRPLA